MVVKLVEIVNPNGRKGFVAETSPAAAAYKRPPSAVSEGVEPVQPGGDINPGIPVAVERPAKNASQEAWAAYAAHPDTENGLSSEEASQMSRDDLVAHFTSEED